MNGGAAFLKMSAKLIAHGGEKPVLEIGFARAVRSSS